MEHITVNNKSKQAAPTIKLYQQNPLRKVICKEKNQRVHCVSTTGRIRIAGLYVQIVQFLILSPISYKLIFSVIEREIYINTELYIHILLKQMCLMI